MTVEFHVWRITNNVSNSRMGMAVNTLQDLDDQVNFDIDVYSEQPDVPNQGGYNDWDPYIEDLVEHVVDEYGCPSDKEYHMLIINNESPGAGYTYGTVNDNAGWEKRDPFVHYTEGRCDSYAAAGGVNAAVVAYENSAGVYGGHGDKAFRATVLHNAIHGLAHNQESYPADDCDQSHSKDHSLGKIADIDGDGNDEAVTPAQMWYTSDYMSNNNPPCDNCDGEPEQNCNDIRLDITSCAESVLNSSADRLNL
ncbi:hypothetical protein [Halomicrobium salinisoli]|uniref:hypothetical protein n=1 Tax=Halomicrobium salinisoli TaxID=2878391 RepID=UPI001CF0057B|nr:hypothetical protein [Halomicrobium salinisoli]